MQLILGPVAIASNNCIGINNQLPWYIPEDLRHFKNITNGQTILMGRKTYESILSRNGKPLPNRRHLVLSTQPIVTPKEVSVFSNLQAALKTCGSEKIFVIGGARVFAECLNLSDYMYITKIKKAYPGDVFFPDINWNDWQEVNRQDFPDFTFLEYKRKI